MGIKSISLAATALVLSSNVNAASITSYDVHNSQLSGYGNWSHTYDGTISGNEYTDGSGTMNDGIIGTDKDNTHLFSTSDNSSIVLYFNEATNLTSMNLYSFEGGSNGIPGNITGLNITVNGTTEYFATDFFGTTSNTHPGAHESINFAGSSLDGLTADMITLSGFTTGGQYSTYYSISEIEVNAVSAVPVPAAVWLFGSGLLGLVGIARRKKS